MATAFDNGPFTDASSQPFGGTGRDPRYDNQPPLQERVALEFEELLKAPGPDGSKSIEGRIADLIESAGRCPEVINDEEWAGKVGDFLKMARSAEQRVEAARETQNRPLIEARNALKARADALLHPLLQVGGVMRSRLNDYVARQEQKRREQERAAAEAARLAQEEAERIARETTEKTGIEIEAPVFVAPPVVAAPVARGDLGSRVGGRTVWKHERQVPIAKLPKQILENQKVVEAVDQVIAAMVRNGTRELKGVRIYETVAASVR